MRRPSEPIDRIQGLDEKGNGIAQPGIADRIVANVGTDDARRAVLSDCGRYTVQGVLCELEDRRWRDGCNLGDRLRRGRKRSGYRKNTLGSQATVGLSGGALSGRRLGGRKTARGLCRMLTHASEKASKVGAMSVTSVRLLRNGLGKFGRASERKQCVRRRGLMARPAAAEGDGGMRAPREGTSRGSRTNGELAARTE